MYKKIDLDNLNGYPLTQDSLKFIQDSYTDSITALASLTGDNVIVFGVADLGATYGDGWVSIGGELLPFIGGTKASQIVIQQNIVQEVYGDGSNNDAMFTRVAKCGSSGGIAFSSFFRLSTLKSLQQLASAASSTANTALTNANGAQISAANAQTTANTAIINAAAAQSAANTAQSSVASEVTNRTNADNTLQANINTEVTNRTNADNALQANINALKDQSLTYSTSGFTFSNGASAGANLGAKITGRNTLKFIGILAMPTLTGGAVYLNLPAGKRPVIRQVVPCIIEEVSGSPKRGAAFFETNGNMTFTHLDSVGSGAISVHLDGIEIDL